MWLLTSREDAEGGPYTFRIRPGATKTIGRATRADFALEAALVSRVHCRLEAGNDGIQVVDLESTNGTYINDKRITHAKLAAGDRLKIGRVELTLTRET